MSATLTRPTALAARYEALHSRFAARLERRLRVFFRAQARRVLERWQAATGRKTVETTVVDWAPVVAPLVTADDLLPRDEEAALLATVAALLLAMATESSRYAEDLGGGVAFGTESLEARGIMAEIGDEVRAIAEQTRAAVRHTLVEGSRRGYTPAQVASGVPEDGFVGLADIVEEAYHGRALTIARTETARIGATALAETYRLGGVQWVRISDGASCGWTHHDDPDKANGSIRTVAEYRAFPISHPNCIRWAGPSGPPTGEGR